MNKYLTIEEKKKLALEGKDVPICVYPDRKEEKRRKREKRKLEMQFFKNVLNN